MIFRLMAEQKDEDDHKNWCDLELAKTQEMKTDKIDKIDELDANIKKAQTRVAAQMQAIKEDLEMADKIAAYMQEATEIREVGKEANRLALEDAKDAQTAIANAIAVLTAFYKETGMLKKE